MNPLLTKNIALISPSKEVYSETFIQVHKKKLKGNIFYYYGGELPGKLEGDIVINSRKKRLVDLIKGHLNLNRFSLAEQALITSFRNNQIDVVLAEYGGTGHRLLPVCKELDIPLIVHFHGYDASRYDQLSKYENYSEVFNYASAVVVVSKKMERDFLDLGCPKQKLVYNVYGPREDFFQVSPCFQKNQFLFVGRFVDKKAPYYLILSFLKVLQRFPSAKLVMAGKGELLETCKNLTRFYEIEEQVEFPGVIKLQEMKELLGQSIALVQHSLTPENGETEGTPVSVLEAGAAGVPVISTLHAGIPDVVIHEETGLLCPEHAVENMAQNMISLLEDKEKARKLGTAARMRIKEEFNLDRHIGTLDSLIRNALKNGMDV